MDRAEVGLRLSARAAVLLAWNGKGDADRLARCRARAPVFVLACLIAGCASYAPAPIDRVKTIDAFAARRLDAPALGEAVLRVAPEVAATWPPGQWNRATLLAVALAQNASLAVARAEIEVAVAAEINAGAAPNPTLGLQSEYARREQDHWLYGISYDFLFPQKNAKRLDATLAQLGTIGVRTELTERTWSVRRALIAALSDRESARRRLGVLSELAAAQDRLVELQHKRVDAGEDAPTDLTIAQGARIDIEQQAAQARADTVNAQAATAAALGLPPSALDDVAIEWPDWGDPPPVDIGDAREQALLSRADLAVAVNDYAQAETKLQRAIAHQYPQLELKPGYYWDHGIAKWPIDVSFALPFNQNKGEIAEATASREVAGQRMLALQAGIYGEIEAALRADEVARANVDIARQRSAAVRKQLEHADVALGLGAGDRLDRTEVEVLALRAALETVQAQAQRQAARNALEDALHAPLSGPELSLAKARASNSGADR